MGLKIVSEHGVDIPVCDLKEGRLAVVTNCYGNNVYEGTIVQRFQDKLIGINCVTYWNYIIDSDDFRVRVLPPGTVLEIT